MCSFCGSVFEIIELFLFILLTVNEIIGNYEGAFVCEISERAEKLEALSWMLILWALLVFKALLGN